MKTLKKLLFIIMAVAVLAVPVFGVQAAENDIPVTEQSGVSPTPSPVPIRELVTKGNKIYYYYKGKMVKNKWKRYNGYKYYFGANGNAVRGGQRINNVVYVFDEKGRLFENKQNKIVKSGSNIYHIRTEHGRASIGYFIYKNNLYYADPKGRLYQKKSRQNGQLYFTNSGAARKDYNALLKMRVMQVLESLIPWLIHLVLNSLTFLLLFTFPPALFFKFFCFIAVYPGITGLTVSGSKYIIQTIFDCLASGIYSRIYCAVNSLSHRLLNILGHLAVIFSRNCCVYDLFYFVSKFS